MKRSLQYLLLLLLLILLSLGYLYMSPLKDNSGHAGSEINTFTQEEADRGERLASQYCSTCHLFPEPDLLGRDVWMSQTLPAMGPLFGIFEHQGREYPRDHDSRVPEGFYPSEQILSDEEWGDLLAYYYLNAPEQLSRESGIPDILTDPLFFEAHTPLYETNSPPTATVARFDPGNRLLYLSDQDGTNLLIFNRNLQLENSLFLSSTLADVGFLNDPDEPGPRDLLLTYLGSMRPSDAPEGFLIRTSYAPAGSGSQGGDLETVIDGLVRPVQTLSADLTLDGREELLVHEFGHRTGSLFLLKERDDLPGYEKIPLHDSPGCIQSNILDVTGNGLPDILSLCTYTDQSIFLFENLGEGRFERSTLLRFPVTAGSMSFELHDFNGNGHPDILYTSGDNADFSISFKPYHGVYIYLNDGSNRFTEEWFYPVNGAYDAKVSDFNGNGYPDLAVISFFGDYLNRPEEGFLLFMNDGRDTLSFTPYHHPAASGGRWLAMDVADWTGNGYADILLANYSLGPDVTAEQAVMDDLFMSGPLFLLLENRFPDRE